MENISQEISPVKKEKFPFLVALLALVIMIISQCNATIDPKYTKDDPPEKSVFSRNMDNLIGSFTYDQALMTWGEPASVFDGDEIFLATWGNARSGSALFPIQNTWFSLPIERGWKLELSFSKTTRKLVSWNYNKW